MVVSTLRRNRPTHPPDEETDTSDVQRLLLSVLAMTAQKTASDVPVRQVNNILQHLRGEHFRHTRNVQGTFISTGSSHAHNQPTLPINLIYSSGSPAPTTSRSWVPGPSPPRSWQSPTTPTRSSLLLPIEAKRDIDLVANTPAWREHALSLLFSANTTPSPSSSENIHSRTVFPDPSPVPALTLLCLQLIRAACPCADLAQVVPHVPPHLRRALLRYAAIHAPLSQIELDVLCQGASHVDTELVIVGPHSTLRGSAFRKTDHTIIDHVRHDDTSDLEHRGSEPQPDGSWDAMQTQDNEPLALRSLAVLSSPLSAATMLAFPPTITHLALVHIPHRIPLKRLPTICPLLVLLDLSYNAWLYSIETIERGRPILEGVGWTKLRRLEVLGLKACPVTPTLLLELNRGRWEDVRIVQ